MELLLPPDCLVVFVDDTGHEALVEGHPVYGLGGCAAIASDLNRVVRDPWREVRRRVTGSPDTPLHASSFAQSASHDQIDVVAKFFRTQSFARLGAIISIDTTLAQEMGPVPTIAGVLKQRILDIAKRTRFTDLKVVFESSNRVDHLIEKAFGDFGLEESGQAIPTECYFMPKSAGEPALEVADFVMHAIGRQARRILEGRDGFAPDFMAVFHDQPADLVSFMNVTKVQRSEPERQSSWPGLSGPSTFCWRRFKPGK
jgi:hypothetical protein